VTYLTLKKWDIVGADSLEHRLVRRGCSRYETNDYGCANPT
jgi:hypothetical protein